MTKMNYNDVSCCFTGHRKLPSDKLDQIRRRVSAEIERAYQGGYRRFLCGGALGFDTLCALEVIEKRKVYADMRLILVLPCLSQDEQWSEQDRLVYRSIYAESDECYCMSEFYSEGCMHLRNRAMVDDCSLCICYLENFKSGTSYTYNYAKKSGLVIINTADVDLNTIEGEYEDENDED